MADSDVAWRLFLKSNAFDNIKSNALALRLEVVWADMPYKHYVDGRKFLKAHLPDTLYQQVLNRFRVFKSRANNEKATIEVSKTVMDLLEQVETQVGFTAQDGGRDAVIEMLCQYYLESLPKKR